jgi:hypothetical protein
MDLRDCAAIRAELAAEDFDFNAFDADVVAKIERATGRTFAFGAVGDTTGVLS